MPDLFREIIFMSITGSFLAIILFLTLKIFKNKLSKTFQYYIWVIIIIRLIIPFSFEVSPEQKISNYIQPIGIRNIIDKEIITVEEEIQVKKTSYSKPKDNLNIQPVLESKYPLSQPITLFAYIIWPMGLFFSLFYTIFLYLRFNYVLNKTNIMCENVETEILKKLSNNKKIIIYRNSLVNTPMLIGILNPKIILPTAIYSEQQLENILLHELTHLKRFDIFYKWICAIVCALHWFNPIIYFMRSQINKACELSCDESVIKNFDNAKKQNYGDTLICVVAENNYQKSIVSTTMCEEKKNLKERLIAIMKNKKLSKKIFVFSVILLIFFILVTTISGFRIGQKNKTDDLTQQNLYEYNFGELYKYKSPYMGNASNTAKVVSLLKSPNINFRQNFISMTDNYITPNNPYSLTIFYEPINIIESELPSQNNASPSDILTENMLQQGNLNYEYTQICKKNALILFSLIDNLQEVTFCVRYNNSENKLTETEYKAHYTITREIFKDYGELSNLWLDNQKSLFLILDNIDKEVYSIDSSSKYMTIEDVLKISAKGENIVVEDFKNFRGKDIGFGLYIMLYDIENLYTLTVGTPGTTGKPMYVILAEKLEDKTIEPKSIDIRYEDIELFLENLKKSNEEIVEQKKLFLPEISKIEIKFDYHNYFEDDYKSYQTSDKEFIQTFKTMMENSIVISDTEEQEIDRINNPHAEIIIYNGSEKTVLPYILDTFIRKKFF